MKNKKINWVEISRKMALTVSCAAIMSLTACAGALDQLSRHGAPPPMAKIDNPVQQKGYRPVTMPMPTQVVVERQPNSLWEPARQTFFKDQRANKVGDIVTVLIDINDLGTLTNETKTTRSNTENMGIPNLLGLETKVGNVLPKAFDPTKVIGTNSDQEKDGKGTLNRQEQIQLKLAAEVMQVLPNGNFVIKGRQQVRVDYELRDLLLDGVIRPEDILNNNSVSYEKIAEARISYGGKGSMSDLQQSRWGDQVLDAISPF
jgi:flagellar L-ring protein FlgH